MVSRLLRSCRFYQWFRNDHYVDYQHKNFNFYRHWSIKNRIWFFFLERKGMVCSQTSLCYFRQQLLLTPLGSRFATHWRWVMMMMIIFIGLGLIALLAVYLKRRHARKVDERRVASSGFPAAGGGSSPDIGHGRDMWGPHQHMAHTGGWGYTTEQDREMREASAPTGAGVLGSAIGKAKSLKGEGQRRLGKKPRHGSQRSVRLAEAGSERARGEEDDHTRSATASVKRTRSERRREREREREREKEVERGLRGLPTKDHDERAGNSNPQISEKEKDLN
jgi:hypothetical protein